MNDWTISDAYGEQKSDLIALELSTSLYEALNSSAHLARSIQEQRRELMRTHGLFIPSIRIKTMHTTEKEYRLLIRGQRVGQGTLHPPLTFSTEQSEDENEIPGIHPVTHEPGFWNKNDGLSAQHMLLEHIKTVMEQKAPDLLTYETAARWLHQAKSYVPGLVKELEKRGVTPGLIWQVQKRLLAKRVPLHPFEDLLETILEYYIVHPPAGYTPPEWSQSHPDDIVKYIAAQKKKRLPQPGRATAGIHYLKR